jgi:protein SCO1/2
VFHYNQKSHKVDHGASAVAEFKWMKISIIGVGFVALLATVFALSNWMAVTMPVGIPNFQDSRFELVDQNDDLRRPDDFAGRPIALFFGFTFCPDVCPTTLMQLTTAQNQLGESGQTLDDLQILFVTVDPQRDTPSQLNAYLSLFDANVIGLTGTDANIAATLRHFGVYAEKTGSGDDYLYDHSAAVYLYRPDGSFKGTIVHNEPLEFAVEKLRSILK